MILCRADGYSHPTSSQMGEKNTKGGLLPHADEKQGREGDRAATGAGLTSERAGEACWGGVCRGKGLRMSPLPPRPLCLTDEFKQDMVIACLQHSPNH